jgi:hypothetical protein
MLIAMFSLPARAGARGSMPEIPEEKDSLEELLKCQRTALDPKSLARSFLENLL